MTCNTCNECNPCEKENTPCCELKVLAGDCVDVEEVNWAYVVSATCPPEVVEWDGIEVEVSDSPREWYSKRYTVNATDKKVAVCSDDKAWYLNEKIRWVSPIEVNMVGCWTSDWYMQISLDEDALDAPNDKVAVTQWCRAQYLVDAINVDSSFIKASVDSTWCTLNITDREDTTPVQYAQLVHSWGSHEMTWNTTPRIYAVNSTSGATWDIFSGTWDIKATPAFTRWGANAEDIITINENWIYSFTYESYVYCDYPIIYAIRAWLWVWWLELWDFKYNWTYWSSKEWFNQIMDLWFPSPESEWVTWWALAMDNLWFGFSWSFTLLIDSAPTSVRFAVKPDTRMIYDPRIMEEFKWWGFTAHIMMADSTEEIWPQSVITITKLFDYSNLKNYKPK